MTTQNIEMVGSQNNSNNTHMVDEAWARAKRIHDELAALEVRKEQLKAEITPDLEFLLGTLGKNFCRDGLYCQIKERVTEGVKVTYLVAADKPLGRARAAFEKAQKEAMRVLSPVAVETPDEPTASE